MKVKFSNRFLPETQSNKIVSIEIFYIYPLDIYANDDGNDNDEIVGKITKTFYNTNTQFTSIECLYEFKLVILDKIRASIKAHNFNWFVDSVSQMIGISADQLTTILTN
jgi:hypothetical protein